MGLATGGRRWHASCGARDGAGVLLVGASGAGKSDLLLRLIDRGFSLVADDQVEIIDGFASPPLALAGLIEVRGLGIFRMPYLASAKIVLVVQLLPEGMVGERLPAPTHYPDLDVSVIQVVSTAASTPLRIGLALDCAQGRAQPVAGAFA